TGDFMELLPKYHNLLLENKKYSTFRQSIAQTIKQGNLCIGMARAFSILESKIKSKVQGLNESVYAQMQYMWKNSLPFLPKYKKEYDVAISYLWPHYFVADKVKAKIKIAWIHTDYSKLETDIEVDMKMWDKFDHIIAVSEECKNAFLQKYGRLKNKVRVIENITSPGFIEQMSKEKVENLMTKDDCFKLVSVARLSYAKGIDNAVRALKILVDRGYDNIKWYIVGYGGDEQIIKDLIKENNLEDKFILLGKQINPYPYIKSADLYIQPSRYEGKAVTVCEAQILSKPVLITNYTTAQSQIKNGFDGCITELSIEGIADGIEKLYKDEELRVRLSTNCKNTNYGNKKELEKLYNLFN
ncbi:MAG: glycosyltransferase, partial [Peptostreptococcaceae bacterium]|nr:glycosyltransferase [Peptostreptococcaceae bacterium]